MPMGNIILPMAKKSNNPKKVIPQPDIKLGRPPKTFTRRQLELIDKYAYYNCKDNQIATILGIDSETFKRHFEERCRKKRAEGQAVKLEQQFNSKAPVMLIWWGKQYLDQNDKQEIKHDIPALTATPLTLEEMKARIAAAEAAGSGLDVNSIEGNGNGKNKF